MLTISSAKTTSGMPLPPPDSRGDPVFRAISSSQDVNPLRTCKPLKCRPEVSDLNRFYHSFCWFSVAAAGICSVSGQHSPSRKAFLIGRHSSAIASRQCTGIVAGWPRCQARFKTTRSWPRAGCRLPCNFVLKSVPLSMTRTEHSLTQRINSVPQVMIPDSDRQIHALTTELNLDQSVPSRSVAASAD